MVDPQEELKEKCGELPQCSKLREILDTCNERVEGKSNTTEDCNSELFDFIHCVDHCVSGSKITSHMLVYGAGPFFATQEVVVRVNGKARHLSVCFTHNFLCGRRMVLLK